MSDFTYGYNDRTKLSVNEMSYDEFCIAAFGKDSEEMYNKNKDKEKDLCHTCEHYWLDFPMPLDRYIPHCDVLDKMPGKGSMDDEVDYPCLKCPFESYKKKQS